MTRNVHSWQSASLFFLVVCDLSGEGSPNSHAASKSVGVPRSTAGDCSLSTNIPHALCFGNRSRSQLNQTLESTCLSPVVRGLEGRFKKTYRNSSRGLGVVHVCGTRQCCMQINISFIPLGARLMSPRGAAAPSRPLGAEVHPPPFQHRGQLHAVRLARRCLAADSAVPRLALRHGAFAVPAQRRASRGPRAWAELCSGKTEVSREAVVFRWEVVFGCCVVRWSTAGANLFSVSTIILRYPKSAVGAVAKLNQCVKTYNSLRGMFKPEVIAHIIVSRKEHRNYQQHSFQEGILFPSSSLWKQKNPNNWKLKAKCKWTTVTRVALSIGTTSSWFILLLAHWCHVCNITTLIWETTEIYNSPSKFLWLIKFFRASVLCLEDFFHQINRYHSLKWVFLLLLLQLRVWRCGWGKSEESSVIQLS